MSIIININNMLSKKCLVCGKEFVKPISCSKSAWFGGVGARRPNGVRFCSKKCSNIYKTGISVSPSTQFGNRDYIPWLKGTRGVAKPNVGSFKKGVKLSEETKAKMIGRTPWNKGKDFYAIRGDKNKNWKGGRTSLRATTRTLAKYLHWRTNIFQRDGYKCVLCGSSGKLHSHHIKPFSLILEENNIVTVDQARDCYELWETSNGQTLCIPCHKQTGNYLKNAKKILIP
ncbi:MAG: HNH endonuclease signature motif containing protein [Minisyncoccia bacterium]